MCASGWRCLGNGEDGEAIGPEGKRGRSRAARSAAEEEGCGAGAAPPLDFADYLSVSSAPPMPMNKAPVVRLVKRDRAALWRKLRFIQPAHTT